MFQRRLIAGLALALALSACVAGCAAEPETESESGNDALTGDPVASADPAYAPGKRHSSMTPEIIASLKRVLGAGRGDPHQFVKVGDSITASTNFLDCLDVATLSGEQAELEPARAHFDRGSWQRRSQAATPGWHTNQPLAGSPSPLDVEVSAMNPGFAFVMLGTNDNFVGTDTTYRANLGRVVSALLARHVVPILSTIPPSARPSLDANIPRMNTIVRNLAAEKQIPLMNFHGALADLPGRGISSDTIHPNVGARGACDFSADGLRHGYNVRTLLALEAIARMKDFLLGAAPPETP